MKKILISFGLLISLVTHAQKIERDYFEDNMHKIETEWEEVEDDKDERDFFVMLLATKIEDTTHYYLMFQLYSYDTFNFDVGSKLLIKTMTDDILSKECVRVVPTKKTVCANIHGSRNSLLFHRFIYNERRRTQYVYQ